MEIKEDKIQYARDHSLEMGEYPDVFDKDFGSDFHLETKPDWFCKIDEPREVKIEITSFIGCCAEAVHYYAKLDADGIRICSNEVDGNGNERVMCHGGYLGEEYKNLPRATRDKWSSHYTIEIAQGVTQDMIDKDPRRWDMYEVGYKTNAFENKKELIAIAKKVAAIRFPGWVIKVDDCTK